MGKGRAPCCDKSKVKKGPWSPQEDLRLINFIQKHGHSNWRSLPNQAGLLRCGKSCRLRWINYLRPDLKRGNFTKEDEDAIIELHHKLGNRWSKIASCFPGRTDNEIKNVWHTHLKKKLNKKEDHFNHHKDEIKELSKSSSFSYSSSSSADESEKIHMGNSILSLSSNQDIGIRIDGKKPGNEESKEISSSSNSPSALGNCSNSGLTDVDFMGAEDIDFLTDYVNQENYEMILNPNQDTESFPVEIDFDFLEMLDKEDPIDTYHSQAKEIEICQTKFAQENEKENECMKWMKNLENELLLETIGGEDQYLSQDAYGQFLFSP